MQLLSPKIYFYCTCSLLKVQEAADGIYRGAASML